MEKLELIKTEIHRDKQYISSLRDLYLDAGMNKSQWSRWCKTNVLENKFFILMRDFDTFDIMSNGNNVKDYKVTLEMGKSLVMQMRTERAEEYRRYLIRLEEAWNTPDMVMTRALQLADRKLLKYESDIKVLNDRLDEYKPKVEFYDTVVKTDDWITFKEVANILAIPELGRNNLMKQLRDKKYLTQFNKPYQRYIDQKLFKVVESVHGKKVFTSTVVSQKGVDRLIKEFK